MALVVKHWGMVGFLLVVPALAGAEESPELLGPPIPRWYARVAAAGPTSTAAEGPDAPATTAAADADQPVFSLLDCVEMALVNNPDIGASREAIRRASGERRAANGQILPPLSFSYSEFWQQQTKVVLGPGAPPTLITPGNMRNFSLNSDWVIYAGGALRANQAIARISEVAAGHQHRATINNVIGQVVDAYLQLLRAVELKQVADLAVAQAEEQVKVATDSFTVGAVPKVDVFRAQAALQNTLQSQLQADNAIALSGAQLNAALGRSQLEPIRVMPLPRQIAEPPELLDSLKLAILQRPELRAQQKAIDIDKEAVRAARAGYLPTLGLNSKIERTVGVGEFGNADNFQVIFAFRLNIWDWWVTAGKVRAADADLQAERRRLERTMHNIELQIRQAVLRIEEAQKRVEAARAEVEAAHQALEIEELRYKSGEGIYLELLAARTAATQADANLVTAYYDSALAEAAWLAATGGYVAPTGEVVLPQGQTLPQVPEHRSQGMDYDQLLADYDIDPREAAGADR